MRVLSAEIAPLAICAFLFGMFNVLVDVPMNAHASVVESRWGRAIMSSFHAAWSGGGLVGPRVRRFWIVNFATGPPALKIYYAQPHFCSAASCAAIAGIHWSLLALSRLVSANGFRIARAASR